MSVAADESARPLENVRAQLQAGWQFAGPAFERPAYVAAAGQVRAVELLLCAAGGRQIVIVPDGPALRHFLHDCGLAVIEA
jgi:hypothetical protein